MGGRGRREGGRERWGEGNVKRCQWKDKQWSKIKVRG